MNKVWMVHPEMPETENEPVEVDEVAFYEVWSPKGWTMVDESEVPQLRNDDIQTTLDGEPVFEDYKEVN